MFWYEVQYLMADQWENWSGNRYRTQEIAAKRIYSKHRPMRIVRVTCNYEEVWREDE